MPSLVLTADAREAFSMIANLPEKVQKKILPKAARASAAPQVKMAKQILRTVTKRRTGLLEKSIGVRKRKAKWNRFEVAMIVGPRAKIKGYTRAGDKVWPIKYSHLVEMGHRLAIGKTSNKTTRGEVLPRRNGRIYGWLGRQHQSSVAARPFLKPAVEGTSAAVIAVFAAKVKAEIANANNYFQKVKK